MTMPLLYVDDTPLHSAVVHLQFSSVMPSRLDLGTANITYVHDIAQERERERKREEKHQS